MGTNVLNSERMKSYVCLCISLETGFNKCVCVYHICDGEGGKFQSLDFFLLHLVCRKYTASEYLFFFC